MVHLKMSPAKLISTQSATGTECGQMAQGDKAIGLLAFESAQRAASPEVCAACDQAFAKLNEELAALIARHPQGEVTSGAAAL
jgi:hypothetical protein